MIKPNYTFLFVVATILIFAHFKSYSQCTNLPTVTCGNTYTGSVPKNQSNWTTYTGCGYSDGGGEAIYAFTAPATGTYTFDFSEDSGDPDFYVMSSCGSTGTNMVGGCTDGGTATATLTGGVTYYVIIDNYSTTAASDYTFSVTCPTTGPCASATTMVCGNTYTAILGTTNSDWSSYTSCGYTEPGDEAVYAFTPTTTGQHTFTTSTAAGDADFFLMSTCSNTGTNLIGACWSTGNQTVTLTAGVTYYLIADNYSSTSTATFTVGVTCPNGGTGPCATATTMVCGNTYTATLGTTNSDWSSYTSCGYTEPGDEAVFAFSPTTTGQYTFTTLTGSGDADFFLMNTCSNTGTNVIGACWSIGDQTVTLTAGVTYYLIVDNYSSTSTATFTVGVDCPAVTTNITACSGMFYDSGGAAGTYTAGEDHIYVICPTVAGSRVQLNFTDFDVEANVDYVSVFDGPNTSSPSLGTYDNNVPLTGIVQATTANASGCLTLVFHSDASIQLDGWVASISCTQPCQLVQAVFASSTPAISGGYIDICQGQTVTFNGSANYPQNNAGYFQSNATSTFTWSFGDGTTATGQTVTHTYANEGGYNVDLSVTDVNGCTSNNDIDIRVRVSTTPVFNGTNASPTPICAGATTTLTGVVTPTTYSVPTGAVLAGTTFLPDGSGVEYTTDLCFVDFSPGQTVTSASDIVDICMDLEHAYLGDLHVYMECPNGDTMTIFNGYTGSGGSQFLGEPVDDDASLTPGDPYTYCFDPTAASTIENIVDAGAPTYSYIDNDGNTYTNHAYIPGGSYDAEGNWTNLNGCPLNGCWTIHVVDHLGSDNGYIFQWGINFNPALYPALWSFTPVITSDSWSCGTAGSGLVTSTGTNPVTITPTAAGTYTYTYSVTDNFGCTYDTTVQVTVTSGTTPTFTQLGPYCQGVTPGVLPTTSTNSITGTWSPSSISTATVGTTTYTFTPTAGQCAIPVTMNVVITAPNITPSFTQLGPYCQGAAPGTLPTTSTNSISGTWSPSSISTATVGTTTYTFTPTAGLCATTATMSVVVNANITPTFTQLGPYCVGATPGTLSTTSNNGITGTWNAAVSTASAGTTVYTFTPTAGLCATTATMSVVVNAVITAGITNNTGTTSYMCNNPD